MKTKLNPAEEALLKNHRGNGGFPLPFVADNDVRKNLVNHYTKLVWRMAKTEEIEAVLSNLYEKAYSKGLSDMDKMHQEVSL